MRNIPPRSHASVLSKKTQFTFRKRRRKRWERKVGGSDFSSLFYPLHGDGRGGKRHAVLLFGKVRSAKKRKKKKKVEERCLLFFLAASEGAKGTLEYIRHFFTKKGNLLHPPLFPPRTK